MNKNFKLEDIKVRSFITSIDGQQIRGGKSEVDPTSQSKPTTTARPSDYRTLVTQCDESFLENCEGPIK